LRESGFEAYILAGGLNSWRQAGGRLEGDPFAQKDLNKVKPQSFFQEKDFTNWIVVDISEEGIAKELIPRAVPAPFTTDETLLAPKLKAVVAQSEKSPLLAVLIVDEVGEKYDMVEKHVKKAGIENVFYLKGGVKDYRSYLEDQVLMSRKQEKRSVGVKACPSCP
jgi:hypothetical protein